MDIVTINNIIITPVSGISLTKLEIAYNQHLVKEGILLINYDNVTLSIFDYVGNKVGVLYTPLNKNTGQAYDLKMIHEDSGWKEISFTIPKEVNGEHNPLLVCW